MKKNIKDCYDKIVNKISYRIDYKEIEKFLLKKNAEYTNYKSKLNDNPKLNHLLTILKKPLPLSEKDKEWIEKNAIKQQSSEITSYDLLFSQTSLNQRRRIYNYFAEQNSLLEEGGYFIFWFESSIQRKMAIYKRFPTPLSNIIYFFDLCWNRACPKLPWIRNLYFATTKGKRKVFPAPEILGRLYRSGFIVIWEQYVQNRYYILTRKIKEPFKDTHPSYGPIIRLRRVGQNGKLFNVYKLRTMHAYSEYLQTYIYERNKLTEGGKFANDYRIPKWGRFLRKYWLDEIPMLINLVKGDIKLIGVRPLSQQYYNLYSPELQKLRTQGKPGLFPPYYADMPKTLEEIQASETIYLKKYFQHPYRTNWVYFWRIIYNIFFRKKRSA